MHLGNQLPKPFPTQKAIEYLSSGGFLYIGPKVAFKIVNHFKENTFKILDNDPSRLSEVPGISEKNLGKIVDTWQESRKNAKEINEVYKIGGLTYSQARKAYKHFGNQTISLITLNPYRLTEVYGIGFKIADSIAQKRGIAKDNPFRIESCVVYVLMQAAKSGDCYLPKSDIVKNAGKFLEITDTNIIANVIGGMKEQLVVVGDKYYLPHLYDAEKTLEQAFNNLAYMQPRELTTKENEVICKVGGHLTAKQKEAVQKALKNRLSVITGLPGTGKTTIIKTLVGVLKESGVKFKLCAPTGKAAKRLAESANEEVLTVHRLLEFKASTGFTKNQENRLDTQYLVIDETSMIDILLMKSIFDALPADASMVLVGDADQLPSIGPGNILREIVDKQAATITKLTEIHRQAEGSGIIKVAHSVNSGVKPSLNAWEDVSFVREDNPLKIAELIISKSLESGFNLSEIQVLTPMKKNNLGSDELNKIMQAKLNKENAKTNLAGFFLNDRIIHKINNYNKNVFNGEMGYIKEIDIEGKGLLVDFGDKTIDYATCELDEIELAYALTIHKAQGSQFPCVILPIHTQHYMMLKRQIFYTAITRAEKKIIIIGSDKAIYMAISNNQERLRYTKLF